MFTWCCLNSLYNKQNNYFNNSSNTEILWSSFIQILSISSFGKFCDIGTIVRVFRQSNSRDKTVQKALKLSEPWTAVFRPVLHQNHFPHVCGRFSTWAEGRRITNEFNHPFSGQWEETRLPGENPRMQRPEREQYSTFSYNDEQTSTNQGLLLLLVPYCVAFF